ncbi:SAM-dependent methyltransferase [Leuconostoc palmae]|uniref:SAM-dependent methyltransferase n=1 Tax=Leuconostoc palmae TaxID=501487 RepID=UPI001C7CD17C|nr:SAM-dependent methyltransferase [Leuconostoc palmae]
MILSTEALTHQVIEQNVKVGDIVIDGTTGNGINTRFLATRVGNSGLVLSYATTRDNANATATSLFMSGLSERVNILGKNIDNNVYAEIGLQSQVSVAIFDYSQDAQNENECPQDYLDKIQLVLSRLTHSGIMIVKFSKVPIAWQNFSDNLLKADYNQSFYSDNRTIAYFIERI